MRRLALAAALLAPLAAGAWPYRYAALMRVPGVVGRIVDPIGDFRPVEWSPGPAQAPRGPRPPNVVVILADDLGYNDLGFGGGGVPGGAVPTPNIDGIARAGVEFMRLIAWMRRDDAVPPLYFAEREAAVPPLAEQGLPPGEITLAELLRERGYHTLGLGKWHLGEAAPFRPNAQGFDEYLGFLAGASLYLPKDHPDAVNAAQDFDPIDRFLWANLAFAVRKDGGPRFAPDAHMTDYLAREAARAIAANRSRPFFLYLAFNAPHTPLQALRADYDALPQIADHTLRTYAAMIRGLDRGVGTVLAA